MSLDQKTLIYIKQHLYKNDYKNNFYLSMLKKFMNLQKIHNLNCSIIESSQF